MNRVLIFLVSMAAIVVLWPGYQLRTAYAEDSNWFEADIFNSGETQIALSNLKGGGVALAGDAKAATTVNVNSGTSGGEVPANIQADFSSSNIQKYSGSYDLVAEDGTKLGWLRASGKIETYVDGTADVN